MEQQPDAPAALALDKVIEELAALEAQFVDPGQRPEPALAPPEPVHARAHPAARAETPREHPAPAAEPLLRPDASAAGLQPGPGVRPEPRLQPAAHPSETQPAPATRPAEPLLRPADPPAGPLHRTGLPPAAATLAAQPMPAAAAPLEPSFDFTLPPARQEDGPFTPPSTGSGRSGRRYVAWGACLLAVALLAQGGRWLYQERKDAGSLALVAGAAKTDPQLGKGVQQPALAATAAVPAPAPAAAPEPVRPAPVPPAVPASQPPSGVPPLVMLEPEPPAAAKPGKPAAPAASKAKPTPEPVAKKAGGSPAPKPAVRKTRAQDQAAARTAAKPAAKPATRPAKPKPKREPERQLARASVAEKEGPSGEDNALAATLRACREHGYHATQCVKQGCGMTKYGFACRGR